MSWGRGFDNAEKMKHEESNVVFIPKHVRKNSESGIRHVGKALLVNLKDFSSGKLWIDANSLEYAWFDAVRQKK